MPGRLTDSNVVIDDPAEASQIYNKGWYGNPQSGGALKLDFLEALYLLETSRLSVLKEGSPLDFIQLLKLGNKDLSSFEIKYLVYRDLRGGDTSSRRTAAEPTSGSSREAAPRPSRPASGGSAPCRNVRFSLWRRSSPT